MAVPRVREDNSMDLTCTVNFYPQQNILTPTEDHKRVFGTCVKAYLTKLGGFQDSDTEHSTCQWGDMGNEKRGVQQSGSSSSTATTYTATLNIPADAVARVYGGNGTLTFTANSDSSMMKSLVMLVATAIAGLLLFS
jgi:hypothetical protein